MQPSKKCSPAVAIKANLSSILKSFNFSGGFQIACLGCAEALFQASIKYHCDPMKWPYGTP